MELLDVVYVTRLIYVLDLIACLTAVALARRGDRRDLWIGSGILALALPMAVTGALVSVLSFEMWPVWRFAATELLLLGVPVIVAAITAERLARRRPMPSVSRHLALVACAVVVAFGAGVVASRPIGGEFDLINAQQ